MREVRSVRERERERERERDTERDERDVPVAALKLAMSLHFSLPKICTLVLAKNFALFLAKYLHLSFSSLEWRWVHAFRCQKRSTLRNSSLSSFCFCQIINGVTEDRSTERNDRISGCTVHPPPKNEST